MCGIIHITLHFQSFVYFSNLPFGEEKSEGRSLEANKERSRHQQNFRACLLTGWVQAFSPLRAYVHRQTSAVTKAETKNNQGQKKHMATSEFALRVVRSSLSRSRRNHSNRVAPSQGLRTSKVEARHAVRQKTAVADIHTRDGKNRDAHCSTRR